MRFSKLGFEIETCGRCGGSGRYSYCQMHGSRCFGCGGSGVRHTKRGQAAARFYEESLMVPLHTLAVGDLMQVEIMSMNGAMSAKSFRPITSIEVVPQRFKLGDGEWQSHDMLMVMTGEGDNRHGLHASPDTMVRKAWLGPEKEVRRQEALAYQATLTNAGTVRKRAQKAA